jgi:hypothetical protein
VASPHLVAKRVDLRRERTSCLGNVADRVLGGRATSGAPVEREVCSGDHLSEVLTGAPLLGTLGANDPCDALAEVLRGADNSIEVV